jgi:cysteine desulfuration protein SufE
VAAWPRLAGSRGAAGLLGNLARHTGLDGEPAADVLAVPDDFFTALGLAQAVSPLWLRGMSAMLSRIKKQVRSAVS